MFALSKQMNMSTKNILQLLNVASYIVFIGLCIETGAMLVSYTITLFNPAGTQNLYKGLNLSDAYAAHPLHYSVLALSMIGIAALKAYIFYLVILIFKELNMVKPFSESIAAFLYKISSVALGVSIAGFAAHMYTRMLDKRGINTDVVENYWSDYQAFLMMAGLIYIIAQIFSKGLALQRENDLTV